MTAALASSPFRKDTSTSSSDTTATTTTEPETVSPDVNPQDVSRIDAAYIEGVLHELEKVDLQNLERVREDGNLTPEVIDRVQAISTPNRAAQMINDLRNIGIDGVDPFRAQPRPAMFEVQETLTTTRDCVSAVTQVDLSGRLKEPTDPYLAVIRLKPVTADQDRSGLNPTAWALGQLRSADGHNPKDIDPCI